MKSFTFFVLLCAFSANLPAAPASRGKAHHVIVMVWDGMRPDFVSEETTPNLWKLVQKGVFFRRHHPAYPSTTEVNGSTMATGVYPEHSGLMANREYRPEVDPLKAVGTEQPTTIAKAAQPYLLVPTVVQILQAAGLRTAVAGTKGVALLQDWSHNGTTPAARESTVFYDGKTAPEAAMAQLEAAIGPRPETIEFPNIPQDEWTAEALTQCLWKNGLPAYSMLWMSDPDYSQHQLAPGSQMALAAIKSVDDRLGTVLAALDTTGLGNDTDVFVISDHGFSTISRSNDIVSPLAAAGIEVTGTGFAQPPHPGEVFALSNGGSAMYYIIGHDRGIGRTVTEILQKASYTGVIFSRWKFPGTFDLHAVHIATRESPDIVMAFRWSDAANKYGTAGSIDSTGVRAGKGMHGSLSPYDMYNTLIAAGPDFRVGWEDQTPSGNIDLAPTVLWILGVTHRSPMDGRVLLEAMPGHQLARKVSQEVVQAANPETGWQQYLKIIHVGTTDYFDEGNPGLAAPETSSTNAKTD